LYLRLVIYHVIQLYGGRVDLPSQIHKPDTKWLCQLHSRSL